MIAIQTTEPSRRLIDAKEVGRLLGCSWRTIYRHADSGRIPPGVKLGALRRWDYAEIQGFIGSGCKPLKATRGCRS
jgi:excisionase family DNA binding protein